MNQALNDNEPDPFFSSSSSSPFSSPFSSIPIFLQNEGPLRIRNHHLLSSQFDELESEGEDLDQMEDFLHYLSILNRRPSSTLARQLITDGVELPSPEGLSEEELTPKLWEVIHGLANRNTYLVHTDHLSDRELYDHLWERTLNEPEYEFDHRVGRHATQIDFLEEGTAGAHQIYLQFYADEMDRTLWLEDNPDAVLPEILPPPYDRDQHLPQSGLEFPF